MRQHICVFISKYKSSLRVSVFKKFFFSTAEFKDTHLRGSPHLSRCTAGPHRRSTTPWTVSGLRTLTPPAWATRSTYLDRWGQLKPQLKLVELDFPECKWRFIFLQTRDWNEELQTTRELPQKNLPERLLRERAIFKVRFTSVYLCGDKSQQKSFWGNCTKRNKTV